MKGYTIQEEKICGNCAHFRLHYVRCQEDFYLPLRTARPVGAGLRPRPLSRGVMEVL